MICFFTFIVAILEQAKSRNNENHLNNSHEKTILHDGSVVDICDNDGTRQDNAIDQNVEHSPNHHIESVPEAGVSSSRINLEFSNQINEEILNQYFYCDFGYELRDTKSNDKYSVYSITDQVQEIRKQHGND